MAWFSDSSCPVFLAAGASGSNMTLDALLTGPARLLFAARS